MTAQNTRPDNATNALRYDPNAEYTVTASDVEYRRVRDLTLSATVYRPEGPGPFPLLLDLHGGGWAMFDRHRDEPVDRMLASHGLVVVAIDFRLRGVGVYPDDMQDINHAIRWFKAHAQDFGASADSVGILGFSSGGHQVVLSGLRPRYDGYTGDPIGVENEPDASVNYVVACGCIFDLVGSLAGRWQGEINILKVDEFFGGIDNILGASPQHILDSEEDVALPPLLVMQAGADDLSGGDPDDAARFAVTYSGRGGYVELALVPGAAHIFLNPAIVDVTEGMERGQDAIKAFIARQVAGPVPVARP